MDINENPDEEPLFSDDPEEQLRIENELLKLKMQAELGAKFFEASDLPPEVEKMFLQNVMKFEEEYSGMPEKKVRDLLGETSYKPSTLLEDDQIDEALSSVELLLGEKNISVDFICEYPARIRYEFITNELMDHTITFVSMPGMTLHFIYEEFHPNHKYDIEKATADFMKHWFEQSFGEYSNEMAHQIILPNETMLTREAMMDKFKITFDSYSKFINEDYFIGNVSFQLDDETPLGHSEGAIRYDSILENGETIHFEGPFILYMQYRFDMWEIFYFELPGFSW